MTRTRSIVAAPVVFAVLSLACQPAGAQCTTSETAKIVDPEAVQGSGFGHPDLAGDLLVTGAGGSNGGEGSAKVWQFDPKLSQWVEIAELTASDGPQQSFGFGFSTIRSDGELIAVGGNSIDGVRGAVYVYERPPGGWTDMLETAKLTASDGGKVDSLGNAIDIQGDTIVVGAQGHDLPGAADAGAAYVFEMPRGGWVDGNETQKLTASDPEGSAGFGYDVGIDGDVIVVGAWLDDGVAADSGSAYVFRYNGTNWIEEQKLLAGDGEAGDNFGNAADVSGDAIIVGAWLENQCGSQSGSAYVFRYNPGMMLWEQEQKLLGEPGCAAGDKYGEIVELVGDLAIVAAFQDDGTRGAVFLDAFNGTEWMSIAKLIASDGVPGDGLGGNYVTIDGDWAAAGSSGGTGAVYVYRGIATDCNGNGIIDLCDIATGVLTDADGNGIADECEDGVWIDSMGGEFGEPSNWLDGLVPGVSGTAVFDGIPGANPPTYPVAFAQNTFTDRLIVSSEREVQFFMGGFDYDIAGAAFPDEPALTIGELADLNARLRVQNGTGFHGLTTTRVSIGDTPSSIGRLTIAGILTTFDATDMNIGFEGTGAFVVEAGGTATTSGAISIGTLAGAFGQVQLTGTLSDWTALGNLGSEFVIGEAGNGSLTISDGAAMLTLSGEVFLAKLPGSQATVSVTGGTWTGTGPAPLWVGFGGSATVTVGAGGVIDFPTTVVVPNGELCGDGTIVGLVFNSGDVRPGIPAGVAAAGTNGVLTIQGSYAQTGVPPGGSKEDLAGTLFLDIAGPTPGIGHDQLNVTGNVDLGGGVILNLANEFDPGLGETFDVVSFASNVLNTRFDVAFMPGLSDGRFMRVAYGGGAEPGPGGATIIVDDLKTLFGYGSPIPFLVGGEPSDVVLEDFDNDGDEDLAITIPEAVGEGQLLVLPNAGTDVGGNWLGFDAAIQITVGQTPTAIAVGHFNNDTLLDLAVANATSNDVSVLLNTSSGTINFSRTDVATGGTIPSAIGAAQLDGDLGQATDLAVAHAGSDDVTLLVGTGTGVFVQAGVVVTLPAGSVVSDVDPCDVDNDSNFDIMVSLPGPGTVGLAIGNGDGSFGTLNEFSVGAGPADLAVGTLDGDGLLDVAVANITDGTVSILLNDGAGGFLPAVNLPVGESSLEIVAFDAENDGDLDLAVVTDDAVDGRLLRVLRNDLIHDGIVENQLTFAPGEDQAVGETPILVAAGDVDGDPLTDLVTISGMSAAAAGPLGGDVTVRLSAQACPIDLDGDGLIAITDLLILLAAWGTDPGGPPDYDGSGDVGITDLLVLLAAWGPCA